MRASVRACEGGSFHLCSELGGRAKNAEFTSAQGTNLGYFPIPGALNCSCASEGYRLPQTDNDPQRTERVIKIYKEIFLFCHFSYFKKAISINYLTLGKNRKIIGDA